MAWGGVRKGAGRKPVAIEEKTREKAKAAICAKHGSIEEGLKSLLDSGEPSLVKFVYEHALGKPAEEINVEGEMNQVINWIPPTYDNSNTATTD
jgi:hypothetical protein